MSRRIITFCIDLSLVALLAVGALLLRDNFELDPGRLNGVLTYALACVFAAAFILPAFGAHQSVWRLTSTPDYLRMLFASLCIVMAGSLITFAHNRLGGVARSLPLLHWFLLFNGLVGVRFLARLRHERRGRPVQLHNELPDTRTTNILVVGQGRLLEVCLRAISEFATTRAKVVGVLCPLERYVGRTLVNYKVLGTPEQVESSLRTLEAHGVHVDRIVIAAATERLSVTARLALADVERSRSIEVVHLAQTMGLEDDTGLGNFDAPATSIGRSKDPFDPRLEFSIDAICEHASKRRGYWFAKRLIDIVVATILIIGLSPFIVLAAFLTAIDVGRPLVFWQQRPGLGGRMMRVYKFRTMTAMFDVNGERLPDESRVSRIGEFMRRSRLDELPQLLNVLMGSMSIVGPRPLLPNDQAPEHAARLVVRPGVTGWAQVQGGRVVSPTDKAALDVWYIMNASFWLDFKIAVLTLRMMFRGEKANSDAKDQAWSDLYAAGVCKTQKTAYSSWAGDQSAEGLVPNGGPAE